MRRLRHLWQHVKTSYWPIPSLFAALGVLLAVSAGFVDRALDGHWPDALRPVFAITVIGARSLLDTIAGSMITVAGVTFSITMVALSTASANYGPRLLENFRRDRGSQVTLGIFVGTFLYCLLLMRVIVPQTDTTDVFVPRFGVALAVLMTVASVAVLVYFVHHVVQMLSVSSLVARVGAQLRERLCELYPRLEEAEPLPGEPWRAEDPRLDLEAWPWHVESAHSGYVQRVEHDLLRELARRHGVRIALHVRTGDFVHEAMRIASLAPGRGPRPEAPPDPACLARRVRALLSMGRRRTSIGDIELLIDQLIEVAQRALSPGINDVLVSMSAMDWLGDALREISRRHLLPRGSEPHILLEPLRDFDDFCALALGALRQDLRRNRRATLHMIGVLSRLALNTGCAARRESLIVQLRLLQAEAVHAADDNIYDTRIVEHRVSATLERIERRYGVSARTPRDLAPEALPGDDDAARAMIRPPPSPVGC